MSRRVPAKRIASYGLMTALALVLSYVEAILPLSLGVPGAKIGLPNIIIIAVLYYMGTKPAVYISVMRIFLSGFMFGNLFAIIYSLFGLVFSMVTMVILKKSNKFSMTGVSVAGGVMHNLGQLTVAALVAGPYVMSYFPMLIFTGVLAGVVIGLVGGLVSRRLWRCFK
ncbi:MAG: Gx transporter family protein [Eubacteriales bacterium]|nr:Gx transporter family protein [Eubacteriales bacterium]